MKNIKYQKLSLYLIAFVSFLIYFAYSKEYSFGNLHLLMTIGFLIMGSTYFFYKDNKTIKRKNISRVFIISNSVFISSLLMVGINYYLFNNNRTVLLILIFISIIAKLLDKIQKWLTNSSHSEQRI